MCLYNSPDGYNKSEILDMCNYYKMFDDRWPFLMAQYIIYGLALNPYKQYQIYVDNTN